MHFFLTCIIVIFFWAIFGAIFDKNMEKSKIIRKMKKMTMRGEK